MKKIVYSVSYLMNKYKINKRNWVFEFVPVKKFNVKNQEFLQSENYLVNSSEHYSALNFMVFATELKLLIFKISARTFLKNFSFRKE